MRKWKKKRICIICHTEFIPESRDQIMCTGYCNYVKYIGDFTDELYKGKKRSKTR